MIPWLTQILDAHGEIMKRVKIMMYNSLKELFGSLYYKSLSGSSESDNIQVLMVLFNEKMTTETSISTLLFSCV